MYRYYTTNWGIVYNIDVYIIFIYKYISTAKVIGVSKNTLDLSKKIDIFIAPSYNKATNCAFVF